MRAGSNRILLGIAILACTNCLPVHADDWKPPEVWFVGHVYDTQGNPVPHARIYILNLSIYTDENPGFNAMEFVADASGQYKVRNSMEFWSAETLWKPQFAFIHDATNGRAVTPRITLDGDVLHDSAEVSNTSEPKILPGKQIYLLRSPAYAKVKSVTFPLDLHDRRYVKTKCVFQREDQKPIRDLFVDSELDLGKESSLIELEGFIHRKEWSIQAGKAPSVTCTQVIDDLIEGFSYTLRIEDASGFGFDFSTFVASATENANIVISADHYRKCHIRVIDEQEKGIQDADLTIHLFCDWSPHFCFQEFGCSTDETGYAVSEQGSYEVDRINVFPPEGYEKITPDYDILDNDAPDEGDEWVFVVRKVKP